MIVLLIFSNLGKDINHITDFFKETYIKHKNNIIRYGYKDTFIFMLTKIFK